MTIKMRFIISTSRRPSGSQTKPLRTELLPPPIFILLMPQSHTCYLSRVNFIYLQSIHDTTLSVLHCTTLASDELPIIKFPIYHDHRGEEVLKKEKASLQRAEISLDKKKKRLYNINNVEWASRTVKAFYYTS